MNKIMPIIGNKQAPHEQAIPEIKTKPIYNLLAKLDLRVP